MSTSTITGYTDVVKALPDEAFLGSLLWFSISQADVLLTDAQAALVAAGLPTHHLRKNLRPIDAFKKAARDVAHSFPSMQQGIRSAFLNRSVGEDETSSFQHIILERTETKAGKKRRLVYEKVAEIILTRGTLKKGVYSGHSVEVRRSSNVILEPEELMWLDKMCTQATVEARYDHYLTHLDSHAVRTYVRGCIADWSGTQVKETGGLYFVPQQHHDEVKKLWDWVVSIGSQFHTLPILDLAEQRQMLIDAFESETISEVETLIGEVGKILADPDRTVNNSTFDAYGEKAALLSKKVIEYNQMLGARAERAEIEIQGYVQQVMALADRIREPKSKPKVTP